jgi:polyphosphate:AMP phosphotransferase
MFEAAELGSAIERQEYEARVPRLRTELLRVQRALSRHARFPVIVVFGGVDAAGKSETVNLLNEWMDPRWIVTRAFGEPTDEERGRPEFWRYWQSLPPRGQFGLFLRSWYSPAVLDRVYRHMTGDELDAALDRIRAFEQVLVDDGALILKFWMHLGRDAQKKRLTRLERDPLTRWRVTKEQWKHWRWYDRFEAVAERVIERTSTAAAPWHIIEGEDERYRNLAVGSITLDATRKRLAESKGAPHSANSLPERTPAVRLTVLSHLDMSRSIERRHFRRALETYQGRLNALHRKARNRGIASVLVFEGWDAAGKGGAIRRLTAALDAASFDLLPIAAPTDEERAHHYLWRFWRRVPGSGRLTIFDRSWYGRVLVERVEGFASPGEWQRAYSEINQFEDQLINRGIVLVKYWLHITQDEQLRRFKERESEPYKRWKLTDEDWRNRDKWKAYATAVNDMIARTSTPTARWTLVEANDKYYARIKVLKTLCARLERVLKNR